MPIIFKISYKDKNFIPENTISLSGKERFLLDIFDYRFLDIIEEMLKEGSVVITLENRKK